MNSDYTPWTDEEKAIIKNGMKPREQLLLLPGRTIDSIMSARKRLKRNGVSISGSPKGRPAFKESLGPEEESDLPYTGKKVPLYKFISTKEATPARIKEWGRLTREEERAMKTF